MICRLESARHISKALLEEPVATMKDQHKERDVLMHTMSIAGLRGVRENLTGWIAEMPGADEEVKWAILKAKLYDAGVDLAVCGNESEGEVKQQVVRARRFVREAVQACEHRRQSVKHAMIEAGQCLRQVRQALESSAGGA